VLAVGDEEFQNRCAERFAELRAEGRTIVVVSHSLGSIQSICDEVAWLDGGVLRSSGPAGDVVDEYLTEVHRQRGGALPATTGRWGSQEIILEEMEVLDGDGGEHGLPLRTGGSAVFRFHYRADGPVPRPMFTLAIHTLDGTTITNPSTHEPPAVPGDLNGAGHIDLVVDRLPLLPGTYDLSVPSRTTRPSTCTTTGTERSASTSSQRSRARARTGSCRSTDAGAPRGRALTRTGAAGQRLSAAASLLASGPSVDHHRKSVAVPGAYQ
jgi:ABC-2 type transport system ATP-binding protein